jgi:hypothetical protein
LRPSPPEARGAFLWKKLNFLFLPIALKGNLFKITINRKGLFKNVEKDALQ